MISRQHCPGPAQFRCGLPTSFLPCCPNLFGGKWTFVVRFGTLPMIPHAFKALSRTTNEYEVDPFGMGHPWQTRYTIYASYTCTSNSYIQAVRDPIDKRLFFPNPPTPEKLIYSSSQLKRTLNMKINRVKCKRSHATSIICKRSHATSCTNRQYSAMFNTPPQGLDGNPINVDLCRIKVNLSVPLVRISAAWWYVGQ